MSQHEIVIRLVVDQAGAVHVPTGHRGKYAVEKARSPLVSEQHRKRKQFPPTFYPSLYTLQVGESRNIDSEVRALGISLDAARKRIGSCTHWYCKKYGNGAQFIVDRLGGAVQVVRVK